MNNEARWKPTQDQKQLFAVILQTAAWALPVDACPNAKKINLWQKIEKTFSQIFSTNVKPNSWLFKI